MYIDTKVYNDGVLQLHQVMSYKDSEELKEFKEFAEANKLKMAVLALNTDNYGERYEY